MAAAAVLAAAGCAPVSAATASAVAAPASASPSWHIVKRVSSGPDGVFTAVTAVGKNGGWAFDGESAPTAWERRGSTWKQVPFPGLTNETVVAAAASSSTDVWAVTDDFGKSRALRWNGRDWSVVRSFPRAISGLVVLSPSDVWVFGSPYYPGPGLGAWHYDGRTWSAVASGHGLEGGSALSACDIWAFDGTDVAHWNGTTWVRTSVAPLLPAKQFLNDPSVTGVFAQSPDSVYAIGSGNLQDEGGPLVVLHWNGRQWSKVAGGDYGAGPIQQISSDGRAGFWLPMPGGDGRRTYLLHYSAGHLTSAALPVGPDEILVDAVALIPGTTGVLAGGDIHGYANPGTDVVAVVLQYGT